MAISSISLLTNTGTQTAVTGSPVRVDTGLGGADAMITIAAKVINFIGEVHIEATLAVAPTEDDWFDATTAWVFPRPGKPEGVGETISVGRSFTGNFVWVRARITATTGSVDSILANVAPAAGGTVVQPPDPLPQPTPQPGGTYVGSGPTQSYPLLSNTGGQVTAVGTPVRVDTSVSGADTVITISAVVSNFMGRIRIEGTLAVEPTEDDWFDATEALVFPRPSKPQGVGESVSVGRTFTANLVWIRARMDRPGMVSGLVDRVLVNFARLGTPVNAGTLPGPVQGPTGPQGDTGPTGPQGVQGISPDVSLYGASTISSDGGVLTIDFTISTSILVLMTEDITSIQFENVPPPNRSQRVAVYFKQDEEGSRRVLGWPTNALWPNSSIFVLSTNANAIDLIVFETSFGLVFANPVALDYKSL